jgi:redox-sensitive bicupin YhaK (pirin superfamily)
MIPQTPGKIFLADERGLAESDRFRRYSTFSFGPFAHVHKGPFGRLYGCNEETLDGGHRLEFTVVEASHVLVIPLTGAVALRGADAAETTVGAAEIQVLTLPAGSTLHVRNPFNDALISFLHLWLLADAPVANAGVQQASFNLEALPDQLVPVAFNHGEPLPVAISIGQFAGRQEATYTPRHADSAFFTFVLAGAFEVEGRLLHAKDGLALWDAPAIELEALSNNALVVVLELAKR